MLIRSSLPWRDVDDFGRYSAFILAALADTSATLHVNREATPYRWTLTIGKVSTPLAPSDSGLKAYFTRVRHSAAQTLPPGHSDPVASTTTWSALDSGRLLAEYRRYTDALALAAELNAAAPAEAATAVFFDDLDDLDQCALRTLCYETPLYLCVELDATARRLIARGYAEATLRGMLLRRSVWEVAPEQRKLGRLRIDFAPD